jgi:hypothetical protein
MAEPRSLTDRDHYEQRACQSLVQHSGWREVLLPLIAGRLADTERLASNTALSMEIRLGGIDQRQGLLWLLATIYKKADEVNPFDAARLALWSTLLPPREALAQPESVAPSLWENRPTRRSGGSVA